MYFQKAMEAENQGVKSQFLIRLTSLPVVNSALGQATSAYGRVKQTNSLFDYTLSTVEKSVQYANEKAQPLVKKFESHITSADMLACKGLDKLEQTVPIIKEPTEKIIQDTKALYTNTVQSGVDRYNSLRTYGTSKVSAVKNYGTNKATELLSTEYGKLLTSSVDGALSLTENCINLYLPASDNEEEKVNPKEKPVLERMSYLSMVVHRRARKLASLKIQELQKAAHTTVTSIDVYGRLDQLKAVPETVYTNAVWLIGELNKTPEPVPEGSKLSLQQQALHRAQQVTHGVVSTYNTTLTSLQRLPSNVQSTVSSAYVYTVNVYTTVQQIPLENLPQQLISQARVTLKVDERVSSMVHLLNELPAFQWLRLTAYDETNTNQDLFTEDEIFDRDAYMEAVN